MAFLVRSSEQQPATTSQGSWQFSFMFLAAPDQHPASDHSGIVAFTTIPDESLVSSQPVLDQNPNANVLSACK
jgi:hypothetical protein